MINTASKKHWKKNQSNCKTYFVTPIMIYCSQGACNILDFEMQSSSISLQVIKRNHIFKMEKVVCSISIVLFHHLPSTRLSRVSYFMNSESTVPFDPMKIQGMHILFFSKCVQLQFIRWMKSREHVDLFKETGVRLVFRIYRMKGSNHRYVVLCTGARIYSFRITELYVCNVIIYIVWGTIFDTKVVSSVVSFVSGVVLGFLTPRVRDESINAGTYRNRQ